jgi:uncharacterized OB-fold protein
MSVMPQDPTVASDLYEPAEPGARTVLRASRCDACGRHAFPARTLCPACGTDSVPVTLDGPARLRVLTGVRAQPPGSLVAAPYDVGVAEFDEGLCVIGLVDGPAERGDRVVPVVHEPYEGGQIFAFRRVVA